MKKIVWTIVGILVVVAVVVGIWSAHHKSTKKSSSSTTSSSTNQAAAVNNAVLSTKSNAQLGQFLTDPNGKALYTYANDGANTSNCTGSCTTNWPPYLATTSLSLPTNVGTIKRSDDGQTQYTYKSKPLYYFTGDTQANQATGDGVNNFSAAKP